MRRDYDTSARAAGVSLAYRLTEGLTEEEMADSTNGVIVPKTLNRLLTTETRLTEVQIMALARLVAEGLGCDLGAILRYIFNEERPPAPIQDLLAADVHPIKEEGLTQLLSSLRNVERRTSLCQILRRFPPAALLSDRIMPKLYHRVASAFGRHVEQRYELMLRFGRRVRQRFMLGVGAKPRRIDLFMSDAHFEQLLYQELPAADCTRDELDELFENWIFDCLYARNVHIGIFNSKAVSRNAVVTEALCRYETIMLFDRRAAMKRFYGKPSALWLSRERGNVAAGGVLDRDAAVLRAVRAAVPYDLDDKQQIEGVLKMFLSPSTWAYRAATARCYRNSALN